MVNSLRRRLLAALPAAAALPFISNEVRADAPRLRFATLLPRGSLYHRVLLELGQSWRRAEGTDATFTVFSDGVQGDEADTVRRMRIGQLSGAMISVVGLTEIEPGAAALQYMPLMFRSWEEVDAVGQKLRPVLEQRIAERGFIVLYWGEAGWVRFFSKQPAVRPTDFQHLKIYSWSGSPDQVRLMRTLGYNPVVLQTADILPGLQTGLIDAVPLIASWALAAQIDAVAPHMLDIHWAPVVGATVLTRKAWDGLSPAGQAALKQAAQKATQDLRAQRESGDAEAIEAMRKRGLKVHTLDAATQTEWQQLVLKSYPSIRGTMVPADTFDTVQQTLAEFRGPRAAQ